MNFFKELRKKLGGWKKVVIVVQGHFVWVIGSTLKKIDS
jgi:hypothetical protein